MSQEPSFLTGWNARSQRRDSPKAMEWGPLEYLRCNVDDGVAEVTIDRPKALNALNRTVLQELYGVLQELATNPGVRCVILTGKGERAFVAGADIAEMAALGADEASQFSALGHDVFSALERLPAPVLAAVNGFALGGGCELALACDVIYASEKSKFGQPEVKLGLIPGFGGTVRLPRKVGLAVASEWIFTGDIYGADEAQAVGLVRRIFPSDALLPEVRKIAQRIAQRAPLAVSAARRAMLEGLGREPGSAAKLEQGLFGELFETQDMREGTRAFMEKREPKFEGK